VPETGKRLKSGQKLGEDYLKANLPVVRRRLYEGGERLALVLNKAFAD
jgi:S1/P1 Nuclease